MVVFLAMEGGLLRLAPALFDEDPVATLRLLRWEVQLGLVREQEDWTRPT